MNEILSIANLNRNILIIYTALIKYILINIYSLFSIKKKDCINKLIKLNTVLLET